MEFTETGIEGVWLIHPARRTDDRGYFFRAWCLREFEEHGIDFVPMQANLGFSWKRGTVRGLHYQIAPALEAKLVRCTRGAMWDVAVDLRPDASTYGKWFGAELTAENGNMLYLPPRCAHGYQTLMDDTEMHYMASHFYEPGFARGAQFDDPFFNIQWPLEVTVISEQDRNWPLQQSLKERD